MCITRLLALVSFLIGLFLGFPVLHAAPGDLDPLDVAIGGGSILTTVVQPDGKILIGGSFTSVLGVPRNKIARLDGDGTLDAGFNPNANDTVESIVVQGDGKILLGGFFTTLQPDAAGPVVTRRRIARLQADGTLDTGFDPNADREVLSMTVQADGKIVIVGRFSTLQPNGAAAASTRTRIARLLADGTLEAGFAPYVEGDVYTLAMQADGKVLVAGDFTRIGSTSRAGNARLNANGTVDTSYTSSISSTVNSIAVQADGKILIGGDSFGMARLNANGTQDTAFSPSANGRVYSMALQADGKILIGGYFTVVRSTQRNYIARLHPDGTLDMGFDPNASSAVGCVALQADGKILLGGGFTALQPNGGPSTPRACFARLLNDPATQDLAVPTMNQVSWTRGGGSPEFARVTFESSTDNGATWSEPGAGTRVGTTPVWQVTGVSFPSSVQIRARGVTSDGNGSTGGLVESVASFSGLVPLPEIAVFTGASTVASNERLDNAGTHFFATAVGSTSAAQTFTITNTGLTDLTGLALTVSGSHSADFTLGTLGATTLAPGATTTFTVTFAPSAIGVRNAMVNLASNDADESPFRINLSNLTPDIAVTGSTVNIPDGAATPAAVDGTDFGSSSISAGTITRTYTIANRGTFALNLTGAPRVTLSGTNVADFTVSVQPAAATVAPGTTRTFQITFDPAAAGPRSAEVNIATDDGDENPFNFTIQGTGTLPAPGDLDPLDANVGSGYVYVTAVQPDGKTIIAGSFNSILGAWRNSIARLHADGTLDTGFNPNASVDSVLSVAVQPDGKILLGGTFTTIGGTPRNRIARVHADGTLDTGFDPNANGSVSSVVVQPDGKILLVGSFTTVGGITRNRIARVDASGVLETGFNPNAGNSVSSIAVEADGKLLLGGRFTSVGGTARNYIARIDAGGTLDAVFNPNANGIVNAIAIQADGKLLLGGTFTSIGGITRNRIARLHADGTLDTAFNPNASSDVDSLAIQADGKILLGGRFATVGGTGRNSIARLHANGTVDAGFHPNPNNSVYGIALQADGQVLVGGDFSTLQPNWAGVATRNRFARLVNDPATQSLAVPTTNQVQWTRGGSSPEFGRVTFEWSADSGATWTALGAGARVGTTPSWQITGLTLPSSGQIRARGVTTGGNSNGSSGLIESVTSFSGLAPLPEIAVFTGASTALGDERVDNTATHVFSHTLVGSTSPAQTFTIKNTGLADLSGLALTLTGANPGDFVLGPPSATTLAPEATTTFTVSFAPTAIGVRNAVVNLASDDADEGFFRINVSNLAPDIVVTGNTVTIVDGDATPAAADYTEFGSSSISVGAITRTFLIADRGTFPLSLTGTPRVTLGGTNATDFTVNLQPAATIAPGGSTTFQITFDPAAIGSRSAEVSIASDNGDGNPFNFTVQGSGVLPTPGDLDLLSANTGSVSGLAVQADGKILLGGGFTGVAGIARNRIARLHADGTLDTGFNPDANGSVDCIAVQADGKILLGGGFTMVGGIPRSRIARLDADGTVDMGFDPDANSWVNSIAVQADGKVLLGGEFGNVGGNVRGHIARLHADGTVDAGFDPNANGWVHGIAVQADGKILLGGYFGNVGGTTRNRIARLHPDGTVDAGFDPKASSYVNSIVVQADGKILLGGGFGTVDGTSRNRIARVDASGVLDTGFNPNASGDVNSLALQADGKILLGGGFTTVGGTARNYIARIDANGALDTGFDPNPSGSVACVALQADGRLLLGGGFSSLRPNGGGAVTSRAGIARLVNDPATQIPGALDTTQASWTRGGSSPEVSQATFELSTDGGSSYTSLGNATRVGSTANWQLSGLSIPAAGQLRVRGRVAGGFQNGSSGLVEAVVSFSGLVSPIESWRQLHFGTTANSGNGADTFDFDKDGLVNLIEFAFGLNPSTNSAGQLPQPQRGGGNFTYQFTPPAGVGGVTYGAEWSDNLADWQTIPNTGTGGQRVFSVPTAGETKLFLRLKATTP